MSLTELAFKSHTRTFHSAGRSLMWMGMAAFAEDLSTVATLFSMYISSSGRRYICRGKLYSRLRKIIGLHRIEGKNQSPSHSGDMLLTPNEPVSDGAGHGSMIAEFKGQPFIFAIHLRASLNGSLGFSIAIRSNYESMASMGSMGSMGSMELMGRWVDGSMSVFEVKGFRGQGQRSHGSGVKGSMTSKWRSGDITKWLFPRLRLRSPIPLCPTAHFPTTIPTQWGITYAAPDVAMSPGGRGMTDRCKTYFRCDGATQLVARHLQIQQVGRCGVERRVSVVSVPNMVATGDYTQRMHTTGSGVATCQLHGVFLNEASSSYSDLNTQISDSRHVYQRQTGRVGSNNILSRRVRAGSASVSENVSGREGIVYLSAETYQVNVSGREGIVYLSAETYQVRRAPSLRAHFAKGKVPPLPSFHFPPLLLTMAVTTFPYSVTPTRFPFLSIARVPAKPGALRAAQPRFLYTLRKETRSSHDEQNTCELLGKMRDNAKSIYVLLGTGYQYLAVKSHPNLSTQLYTEYGLHYRFYFRLQGRFSLKALPPSSVPVDPDVSQSRRLKGGYCKRAVLLLNAGKREPPLPTRKQGGLQHATRISGVTEWQVECFSVVASTRMEDPRSSLCHGLWSIYPLSLSLAPAPSGFSTIIPLALNYKYGHKAYFVTLVTSRIRRGPKPSRKSKIAFFRSRNCKDTELRHLGHAYIRAGVSRTYRNQYKKPPAPPKVSLARVYTTVCGECSSGVRVRRQWPGSRGGYLMCSLLCSGGANCGVTGIRAKVGDHIDLYPTRTWQRPDASNEIVMRRPSRRRRVRASCHACVCVCVCVCGGWGRLLSHHDPPAATLPVMASPSSYPALEVGGCGLLNELSGNHLPRPNPTREADFGPLGRKHCTPWRRSDEALGVRVSVALIFPSLLDLEREATYGYRASEEEDLWWTSVCGRVCVRLAATDESMKSTARGELTDEYSAAVYGINQDAPEHSGPYRLAARGGAVARLIASHHGESDSIPGGVDTNRPIGIRETWQTLPFARVSFLGHTRFTTMGSLGSAVRRFVSGSILHPEPITSLPLVINDTGPELLRLVMSRSRGDCPFRITSLQDVIKVSRLALLCCPQVARADLRRIMSDCERLPICLAVSCNAAVMQKKSCGSSQVHAELQQIIPATQFEFRAQHSTTHALTKFTTDTLTTMQKHEVTIAIFLDIAKAFDKAKMRGKKDWNNRGPGAILGHKTTLLTCERRACQVKVPILWGIRAGWVSCP
ncbi:hypothetical protein PR048_005786 [Dryococelus australis]|uniref:Reverse transcriptase domain-containing protein n=1 Tax=Dryococelus australis TaxID=614101 RepID=A0ABQ9IAD6_9NEOP|nr:hypothetical protein PR048_005786 [Dryococelus australis]